MHIVKSCASYVKGAPGTFVHIHLLMRDKIFVASKEKSQILQYYLLHICLQPGCLEVNPTILISSYLAGILPYRWFPQK